MKRECYQLESWVEGKLVRIDDISDKCTVIILDVPVYDWKSKSKIIKRFAFKALGERKADEARQLWDLYKECLVKIIYVNLNDTEETSQKGNVYWREGGKMVVNFESAGREVSTPEPEKVIDRDAVEDESDPLPF